ncbi:MAG TPA: Tex family protein [Microcoleaceae cyanobacterium]
MLNIPQYLAKELSLRLSQVEAALALLAEGATVPFIARYRKERTGEMTEVQLRDLLEQHTYLTELEERKATILKAIADQGKLTDELQAKITRCLQKTELEDLYLPYRPKRRTRATIAREKGLEPLAEWIQALNRPNATATSLEPEAAKYIVIDRGVNTAEEALQGASDILAEAVSERAELRAYLREYLLRSGVLQSRIKPDHPEGSTKFEMYRNYQVPIKEIAPHNLLALLRGENEAILTLELTFDEEFVLGYLDREEVRTKSAPVRNFYREMLKDAFQRLMKTSLINAVMAEKKLWADEESIKTFEANLRELLLAAPAGMKPTLGIDPGFRTGCKVAALSETGKFLEYQAIFPHQSETQRQQAAQTLIKLIQKHKIELIAIGNGTAGRETDAFVTQVLQTLEQPPIKVMVNESGASIYSASPVAIAEFPDLDITIRGAISIARRLQDPLAELVKIDPKSIGVGQYQHDVDQKRLKQKLDETVESCVNYVGVDLNTASKELLTFVSGINATIANNIVAYRNENGAFQDRKQLLKVAKLGPKAFEQAAGFLRIRDGKQPLDNTAVHPESYGVVQAIAKDLQLPLTEAPKLAERLQSTDLKRYVTDTIGEPTLRDIIRELEKPGRDPRAQFTYATFKEGVNEMRDLHVGMELEGVVTNVANFGAFVDIGVHQDGLVHVSQLADRFISDPKQVVKVGQVVKVRVLEVNEALKRISLSMRSSGGAEPKAKANAKPDAKPTVKPGAKPDVKAQPKATQKSEQPSSLNDLKAKFKKL